MKRISPRGRRRALLWLGCTAATSPARALMAGRAPDTPQQRVDPNRPESPFSGVVAVVVGNNVFSGVVIGKRHVLTAAHVIDGNPERSNVVVQLNQSATGQRLKIARLVKHPRYRGFGQTGLQFDIGLIELMEDVPKGSAILPFAAMAPVVGTKVVMVGYGSSGNGDLGVSVGGSAFVKRVGANTLDRFEPDAAGSGKPALYFFDFDSPDGRNNHLGGPTLGNAIETTLASGDSGSPALVRERSHWAVIGISTFVMTFPGFSVPTGSFGSGGGGQLLAIHDEWMRSVIQSSGQ